MLQVRKSADNTIVTIHRYTISGEGQESVWSNDWYGRHTIGQDCEWVTSKNVTIDSCVAKVKELVGPSCPDHTPYRGPCVTCGHYSLFEELPSVDEVVEELEKLKDQP